MIIKDRAIEPYSIESDYNGLTLWEPNGEKGRKKLMSAGLGELMQILTNIIKRKLAAMDGEVSLEEYIKRSTALELSIKDAMGIKEGK